MNVGLIFEIIFAIIVMGMLVVFGMQYFGAVIEVSCESHIGQEMINIEEAVDKVRTFSQGSAIELIVLVPNCVERVCFVDPQHPEVENKKGGWMTNDFISDLVSSNGHNVVLLKNDGSYDGYTVSKLKPLVNFCITSKEKTTVRNMGSMIEISLSDL